MLLLDWEELVLELVQGMEVMDKTHLLEQYKLLAEEVVDFTQQVMMVLQEVLVVEPVNVQVMDLVLQDKVTMVDKEFVVD